MPGHHESHHRHDPETIAVGLLTVSSTRSIEDDPAGDAALALFEEAGHRVAIREALPDAIDPIRDSVREAIAAGEVDLLVTMGGTGVTPDDVSPEAVEPLLDRRLPGFGERFRAKSTEQIGERVIASRALGGIVDQTPVFCVPGSEPAVQLAVRDVILPVGPHLVGLATKHRS